MDGQLASPEPLLVGRHCTGHWDMGVILVERTRGLTVSFIEVSAVLIVEQGREDFSERINDDVDFVE